MPRKSLFDEPETPSFTSIRTVAAPGFVPLEALQEELPGPNGRPARGIARLAAEAPELDQRNDVEYRDLPCRSLISHCESPRVHFEYTINPYRGCEFGCVYCYARYTHEFMELEDWLDFERKVFVKRGAREALIADLRRLDLRGKLIVMGTATDPYQPAERRLGVTRSLLEVFAGRRGLKLSVTTKSDLVARDVDLFREIARGNHVHVNVTVTTPRHDLSRRIEPRAARPDRRLAAVRTLAEAGIRAGVLLMPLLPRINDGAEDVDRLVREAKDAGAQYLATQVLFLRSCSRKRFFPFIEERFPELLPYYRRLYGSRDSEALKQYSREKLAEVEALKRKHDLSGFRRSNGDMTTPEDQLALGLEP